MNQVNLMGRLTKEPELKYHGTENPLAVTRFSLAVDRGISKEKREAGERPADFINCVTFGKSAEFVEKYFRKGALVGVAGRLQASSFEDSEGRRRWATEVVTERHFFGDKRGLENESC